ncbi:MAG: hypothetical protein JO165_10015 [Candidatus Eremiobacteraeota bacterium]|nr:hypothetical protein [Candidatus Eremiobacteraeota bacterium]
MNLLVAAAAAVIAMAAAEYVLPGRSVYHYGWYSALFVAFAIVALLRARSLRTRAAALMAAATVIVAIAGAASGLLGPDMTTIVGAPGASVANADLGGSLQFPVSADASGENVVHLIRGSHATDIGSRRYLANAVLWQEPRTVVYVEARDTRGNHLTVTQPTGASFLSPVLLMQSTTQVAGMQVGVDSFSVPALGRSVKAVLFTPQQAAQLHTSRPLNGYAILFAVSDAKDRAIPGGIGIGASTQSVALAGLRLRAAVGNYPAIVIASTPFLPALIFGVLLALSGLNTQRAAG